MTCEDYSLCNSGPPSFHPHSVSELLSGKIAPASRTEAATKLESFPDYKPGTETILLVEDMESLRIVILDCLEQLGYQVLTAGSGEEALALASGYKDEIHLLLTDVILPQMKGPELAKNLLAARPRIKVIYVSGYAESILSPHGVLEPGTILLHKPFSIKILSAKLREVLEGIEYF